MSIRVMTLVWDRSIHKGSRLLLLLALADFSDDHGVSFPGVKILARKTRLSERAVHNLQNELEASGEIKIVRGTGRYKPNIYQIDIARLSEQKMQSAASIDKIYRPRKGAENPGKGAEERMERVQKNAHFIPQSLEPSVEPSILEPSTTPLPPARVKTLQPKTAMVVVDDELLPITIPASEMPDLQPFTYFAHLCEEFGQDYRDVTREYPALFNKQMGVGKKMAERKYPAAEVRRCLHYLALQEWRETAPDLTTVLREFERWKMDGMPASPKRNGKAKGSQASNFDAIDEFTEKMGG